MAEHKRYNCAMLRLMCVIAHPDDEAVSFGGSLGLYRDRGVETAVVCLTPGQAASHRGGAKNDQELAALRRKEFAAACEVLRVNYGIVLDYPDGLLHRQDLYRIVCELVGEVRKFRPDVIITFGAEGGLTGHTDHSMTSIYATLAYHWAGRDNRFPDQFKNGLAAHRTEKLYYATADFNLPERQPTALAPTTAVIEIGEHLETKIAAFRAHASQAPLWPLFESHVRGRGSKEMFHMGASVHVRPMERETDLFLGVAEK
jgi:LmbE family N-acetylglucosaminyl deacetylase